MYVPFSFFTYDGSNRVATETSPDGGVATFAYTNASNTIVSTIAAPGSRTWTFSVTGTDLTTITDPDTKTHTFVYSSHRVTSETQGTSIANQFHYDSAGLLDQFTQGSVSSPSVIGVPLMPAPS